jgi:hypothetical protein
LDGVFPVPLFSGRLAVLPDPLVRDVRRSRMGRSLAALGLDHHVVYLTPDQLVDPAAFNATRFPVALYFGGEPYWQTVREPEDADAALRRYLGAGGRLLVLPSGPLPFFYNQAYQSVGSAAKFGMRMGVGGFSDAPQGRTLTFHRTADQDALAALPAQFPFPPPHEADQRWRPISGTTEAGARYVPWLTLQDETGRNCGDGAAAIEFDSGARVVYVWCSLMAREDARRALLMATLRYALAGLAPPPASLYCLRTLDAPAVDGALDESIWRLAPAASPFVVRGGPLREAMRPTVVRACWDDASCYLAFACAGVVPEPAADAVQVWFAGNADGAPCLRLTLTADNQLDIQGPAIDTASDPAAGARAIRSAVQRHAAGWTAEIAVPFAAISASTTPPRFGHVQAVQFARRVGEESSLAADANKAGDSVWSATDDPARIDRFGALVLTSHPESDDFDSYPPGSDGSGHWMLLGGTWRVEEGTLVGQDSCADWSQLRGAFRGDDEWRDYSFSVRFRVESRSSNERDGPWFGVRCSLDGDGYVLQFGAGAWYLHKIAFGVATRAENCLAQGPWAVDNVWHVLRLDMRGNRIQGTLDGEPLFQIKDDAHLDLPSRRRGGIMLAPGKSPRSGGTTIVRYDDVIVHLQED